MTVEHTKEMGSQQPKSMLMRRSKKSKAEAEAQGLTQGSQVPLRAEVLTMVESAGGLGEASGSRGVHIHDDDTYDAAMNAPVAIKESSIVRVMKKVEEYKMVAESLERGLSATNQPTHAEVESLTRTVVRFVVFANAAKPGAIISRSDLTQLIMSNSAGGKPALVKFIIARAQWQLAKVFGLDLVELVKPSARKPGMSASQAEAQGMKYFVLKSLVTQEIYGVTVGASLSNVEKSVDAFLGLVLSLIHMSGGGIVEDELWRHVGALGVHRNKRHPQFEAMPQDLIDDFVRKRYLKVEKVPGAEEEKKLYTAAENAVYDVTEEMVQQFVETEMRDMND